MDIFNSQWLLKMLEKSSKESRERMLSLFDILQDWLNAPDIDVKITKNSEPNSALIAFLTEQAAASGAENPAILAEHIVLIAQNAALQALNQPNCNSLAHAKKAAEALILAQTQKEWPSFKIRNRPVTYGIAASVLVLGIAITWLPSYFNGQPQSTLTFNDDANVVIATAKLSETKLSAQDAALMYAKYEQMRNGTCQFLEAIQIPDKDKAVYIENVVGGKIPTNLSELAIANTYLEKVRCNYTPKLMANSK